MGNGVETDFSGIWVPLVTPFRGAAVDHGALAALVQRIAAAGVAGFVVCGSTGEAACLGEAEQRGVLSTVLAHRGACKVMMGEADVRAEALAERLPSWCEFGDLAGFLVTPPAYVRPAPAGIERFYTTIADAAPRPIVLYDIPARTGVRIPTETMLALAAHPMIRAVKDCSGDLQHLQAVIADGRLQVLAGDDAQIFATLALGGAGAIAASAHLRPELFVQVARAIADGRMAEARAQWFGLWRLITALGAEPNPIPVKGLLGELHLAPPQLRPPLTDASPATLAAARRAYDALPARPAFGISRR